MNTELKIQKFIGILFVAGVILVTIPYIILSIQFNYPRILRQPVGEILEKFQEGGTGLILTWWLFAISGIIILVAYNLLGIRLKRKIWYADLIIQIGNISAIVQIIGLMRWIFIVPLLSGLYTSKSDIYSKDLIELIFLSIHQYGGVILGEHLGQIFTISWMLLTSTAMHKARIISKYNKYFAYLASSIYILAQLELFKTIFPDLITIKFAGLIGSTLWLVWLTWIGTIFIKSDKVIS